MIDPLFFTLYDYTSMHARTFILFYFKQSPWVLASFTFVDSAREAMWLALS